MTTTHEIARTHRRRYGRPTVLTAKPLDETAGPVIALLSHRPFAWFTDVDGTISPIAERPDEATVPPRLRDLADRLARRIDRFVVVSGRAPAHARDMVGVRKAIYIGNHGLTAMEDGVERTVPAAEPYIAKVAEAEERLRAALTLEGIVFENKGPVLALHYRQSPDPEAARQTLARAAHDAGAPLGLRVHEGRKIVELRPPLTRDKGAAVREIVRRDKIRGAVYLGDDLTDIDAFRALRSLREMGAAHTVSIAVAAPEVDERVLREADFRVEGIAGVERLLAAVVDVLATGEIR